MTDPHSRSTWRQKFADASRGIGVAVRGQKSFWVHFPAGILVLMTAFALRLPATSMAILWLTVGVVIAAEVANSAFEALVHTVHPSFDPRIGRALDMAAGAVLVLSIAAVAVGICLLGWPLWKFVVGLAAA
ncbi:diacylglycerol kinase [Crateriforma spongiae]|uniref:diacylglycerol kinase n=1 Tax=Crateriforma spongiae TaxID=2724528 RepID=UPI0039AF58FB